MTTPTSQRIISRVMLPATEQITNEAADIEDARKIRFGFSPSYFLNLGSLTGNRYTGYMEVYPRTLYRFDRVFPTGINEDPNRLDEEREKQPAFATVSRSPRTCAEDVRSEAGDRVFAILESLTDRDADAQYIWDVIFPVAVEAEIWAMTDRALRSPAPPPYLLPIYREQGLEAPYLKDGHALAAFIRHLERDAPALVAAAKLTDEQRSVAEQTLNEMLAAANEAYQNRYSRLHTSFGSMESRQNSGEGKKQLDRHDHQCIAETGVKQPADKPVEASQRMGAAIGARIAESSEKTQNHLADAVSKLAEGQLALQQQIAQQNEIMIRLLEEKRSQ